MPAYLAIKSNMESLTVTRAEPEDFNAAWAIVNEYYDAVDVMVREDVASFSTTFFAPGSGVWLARRDRKVVGCIALRRLDSIPCAGEIKRMYVQPFSRQLGIAGLLLNAVHEYAIAVGYKWLYLDSKDDLPAAHAFYRKRGYADCPRYNDNPQATVFMCKQLV
jgi:GNAT superfamily N-acetyltransferase